MKKVTTTLALVGTLTLGLATDATIDAQIMKIQKAPAQERVKLMNEFKQELMVMNQEQRKEAVGKMQMQIHAVAKMKRDQVQERNRARRDQAVATGEMVQAQHMNQHQAGNQIASDALEIVIPVAQGFVGNGGSFPLGTATAGTTGATANVGNTNIGATAGTTGATANVGNTNTGATAGTTGATANVGNTNTGATASTTGTTATAGSTNTGATAGTTGANANVGNTNVGASRL